MNGSVHSTTSNSTILVPLYLPPYHATEVKMSTKQFTPRTSRLPRAIRSSYSRDFTERKGLCRMYFSVGSTPVNRCTPFLRVQTFGGGGGDDCKGWILLFITLAARGLRNARRPCNSTCRLLHVRAYTYTYIHTCTHVYDWKHTSTEKEGERKRRREGERSTRALLMQFPATFTFPSRCTNACVRACMRGTSVHAHGGSSVKRWAIIPDIDLRYCSGFSGSRVFARAIRIFYHCCLPSDHYRSHNRKCPGKTFRAISSRN